MGDPEGATAPGETPGERSGEKVAPGHTAWSFRIGRFSGIEVRVHATFLLLVALFALAPTSGGVLGVATSLGWLAAIFACVVAHEFAHCIVGRSRGAVVHEIVLLPIGGVSRLDRLPESPHDELAMAIAGPLASIACAAAAGVLATAFGQALLPFELTTGSFLVKLFWFNLIIAGFNLLPAFPLDGGRVLRALLEEHMDLERATRLAARTGRRLAVALVVVGLFVDLWLSIIGAFVYLGASLEEAATIVHLRLQGLRVRDAMVGDAAVAAYLVAPGAPVLAPDQPLEEAFPLVGAAPTRALAVADGDRIVGVVRLTDVEELLASPSKPRRERPTA